MPISKLWDTDGKWDDVSSWIWCDFEWIIGDLQIMSEVMNNKCTEL